MATEPHEVRRVDVGDGIYVRVPPADVDRPQPEVRPARVWHVPPVAYLLGAGLAAVALVRLGPTSEGFLAAGVLVVLSVLAAIDTKARILPNVIVLPATAAVLVWQLVFFPHDWAQWILGALGAAVILLLPSLIQRGAVGMGDVKLGALLGAALGQEVLSALMLGFLAVVPFALVLLVRRGAAARRSTLPLGPFLAFGAAVVLLS